MKPLLLLALSLVLIQCSSVKNEDSGPPNILIVLVDDMGYSDIGCYGGEINTPNLDNLAENGVRFSNFYNAARCCPTRASLLTGLYPHEAGMGGMVSSVESKPKPGPYQGFLNDNSVTIAEVLKENGYSTYMSGKWHVGEKPEHWPRKRGFERYFGLINGASSYFEIIKNEPNVRKMVLDDDLWEPPAEGFYMTDAITDKAVEYIEEHYQAKKNPFFMYVAYTAPHWPLHALPEDIAKYKDRYNAGWDALREERYQRMLKIGIIDSTYQLAPRPASVPAFKDVGDKEEMSLRMSVYAAMIDRMDQGIGKIVNKLKDQGALDNTVIMFLSDNGGCNENISGRKLHDPNSEIGERGSYVAYLEPWAYASNTPFRKYKKWAHEGGIATPFIIHWPAKIKQGGTIISQPAHIIDIMASSLDIAGAEYPEVFQGKKIRNARGMSLLPFLDGKTQERTLYWEHIKNKAVRKGDWKLVLSNNPENEWELFNLADDPTEVKNLANENPEKKQELLKLYQEWANEVGAPRENL